MFLLNLKVKDFAFLKFYESLKIIDRYLNKKCVIENPRYLTKKKQNFLLSGLVRTSRSCNNFYFRVKFFALRFSCNHYEFY